MYLIDANIFLEEFLEQEKASIVNKFFENIDPEQIYLSDFSFYAVCIVLFNLRRYELFASFVRDVAMNNLTIVSLSPTQILESRSILEKLKLDFDDAYQYLIAKKYNLQLISFDKDFDRTDLKRIEPNQFKVVD